MGDRKSCVIVWEQFTHDDHDFWNWRIEEGIGDDASILALGRPSGYDTELECLTGLFKIFFGSYDLSYMAAYSRWAELHGGVPRDEDGEPLDVYVREADKEHVLFKAVPDELVSDGPLPEVEVAESDLPGMWENADFIDTSESTPPKANRFAGAVNPRNVLGMAMGAASMCWDPRPTGTFDSQECGRLLDEAIERFAEMEISL